jgi:hypothetical protein
MDKLKGTPLTVISGCGDQQEAVARDLLTRTLGDLADGVGRAAVSLSVLAKVDCDNGLDDALSVLADYVDKCATDLDDLRDGLLGKKPS